VIDTRPLWERALVSRGTPFPRRPLPRLFTEGALSLTDSQFVDLVRALIGLRPLYSERARRASGARAPKYRSQPA
jgi:hypothetical protein